MESMDWESAAQRNWISVSSTKTHIVQSIMQTSSNKRQGTEWFSGCLGRMTGGLLCICVKMSERMQTDTKTFTVSPAESLVTYLPAEGSGSGRGWAERLHTAAESGRVGWSRSPLRSSADPTQSVSRALLPLSHVWVTPTPDTSTMPLSVTDRLGFCVRVCAH